MWDTTSTGSSYNSTWSGFGITITFVGTSPPPPPPPPPPTSLPQRFVDDVYNALAWLEFEDAPGVTAERVRAARRRLAKVHHPDVGGDVAAMQAINAAADFLLRLFSA